MLTKLTPTLRSLINQYEASLPAADVTAFIDYINQLSEQYRVQIEAQPKGAARADKIHELMEQAMASLGNDKPSCRAGCSACCHLEVEITVDEGALLADLVRAGHPIDRQRLATQASRQRKDPEWAKMQQPSNRCVFLGADGACTVYRQRPASCRKLLVVTHPVECATPNGDVRAITIPMAEVLLSTVISIEGTEFMSLSKAVTRGLENDATR